MLGVLTGLQQEAALIRRVFPHSPVELSYASEQGAVEAMGRLQEAGVTKVLSFGCAGGLSPSVEPGTIIVADRVHVGSRDYRTDASLSALCGRDGDVALSGGVLHSREMVAQAEQKRRLYQETHCLAVDMESGVVACSGLPFAVLRVVCDDAARDLPPAAGEAMDKGRVKCAALIRSIVRHPKQISALMSLGRDASRARQAMACFLHEHQESLKTAE
ncbi:MULTISPECIES: hypothetical protein [unclassified Saccharibacter]|uniref:phosphorylase family protein n=1 Tax=unclassified Saccharibacter TaxID=2648722 RepID=UPI00132C3D34|nr:MULTISPECIES: hypothetical protein [unclassified Saccharibacter]MXV36260.1 hypothetical protein [Saccharibacter sp. EH611]MXV57120.1 hypothetical protein [Saccharibacter sp. EH70]MXV66520.1 hypothetical protein [Saccharibacter sp. EH60]